MTGAGSEATSGLREQLEAAWFDSLVARMKSLMPTWELDEYATDRFRADAAESIGALMPVVSEFVKAAVKQAKTDTAEKIAQQLESGGYEWPDGPLGNYPHFDCEDAIAAWIRLWAGLPVARSGGGGTPEPEVTS